MQFGKGVECWEKLRPSMLVVTERVLTDSVCGQCAACFVQTGVNAPTARQVPPCSFSFQDYGLYRDKQLTLLHIPGSPLLPPFPGVWLDTE